MLSYLFFCDAMIRDKNCMTLSGILRPKYREWVGEVPSLGRHPNKTFSNVKIFCCPLHSAQCMLLTMTLS